MDTTGKHPPAQRGPLPRPKRSAEAVLFEAPPGQEKNKPEDSESDARYCGTGETVLPVIFRQHEVAWVKGMGNVGHHGGK